MAFHDSPEVDQSSIHCEESESAVRRLFTRKNGFITRIEHPDYGVDFNVEVVDGKSPTGKSFAIQVKSNARASIIKHNGRSFLTLKFKTSRLGYLYSRKPMYGLIVLYDAKSEVLYFENIEDIFERLRDERQSDDWKENDQVNLRIPIENELNEDSIALIHKRMLARALATDAMVKAHGAIFGIPTSNDRVEELESLSKSEVDFLKDYGLFLVYNFQITVLFDKLSRLTTKDILSSPCLIHLAALVYVERGNFIDADYYIKKAIKNEAAYSNEELASIRFLRIKVDVALGNIDDRECLERLKVLGDSVPNEMNVLLVDLNILQLEFSLMDRSESNNEDFFERSISLFSKIEKSELSKEQKHLLNLYNCENVSAAFAIINLKRTAEFRLKEALQLLPDNDVYEHWVMKMIQTNEIIDFHIAKTIEYASKANLQVLYARALLLRAMVVRNFLCSVVAVDPSLQELKDAGPSLKKAYDCAEAAFQLLDKFGMVNDAFASLGLMCEIIQLGNITMGRKLDENIEGLAYQINTYKANFGIDSEFHSGVERLMVQRSNLTLDNLLINATEESINQYAQILSEAYGYNETQHKNLLIDLKNFSLFFTNCKRHDVLLVHITDSKRPFNFLSTPRYALINTVTGFEYGRHSDVRYLLGIIGIDV